MTPNPLLIADRLASIRMDLPQEVTLVAVSKTKPVELLAEALDAGQLDLGENRTQEMAQKAAHFDRSDIRWHHIGHLQTNKVKQVVPHAHLIHAVDSRRLLDEIDKRSRNANRNSSVLLQLHIAQETQKHGLDDQGLETLLESLATHPLTNTVVQGLMGMATFTDDTSQVTREFKRLRKQFDALNPGGWTTCSMGMSGDWKIAVDEGSTLVRIGSAIFGER